VKEPNPAEKAKTTQAWQDASSWWQKFADNHPRHPGQSLAKRMRARSLMYLNDRKDALKVLEDQVGALNNLDKLALEWLARQARDNPPR
jgi:hypothetical protein